MKEKLFELGRLTIVDLYDWNNREILKYDTYFQRQAAWKEKDRIFLIDSIINGYPLPSIFICDASIDYDSLKKQYNVLDGRQRLESIFKFLKNEFKYNNKFFNEMSNEEKDRILSYSIPIVQIYIDPTDVNRIKEIFKRLNTNSRNLNKIEKDATKLLEYDFMLLNKVLVGIVNIDEYPKYKEEIDNLFQYEDEEQDEIKNIFTKEDFIFSKYFIGRQVNLQHLLNILGSIILEKIIHRNLQEKDIVQISENMRKFEVKEKVIKYNDICKTIFSIYSNDLLDKFWKTRTNLYSLSYLFYNKDLNIEETKIIEILNNFKNRKNTLFQEYNDKVQDKLNDKNVRERRNEILNEIFFPGQD